MQPTSRKESIGSFIASWITIIGISLIGTHSRLVIEHQRFFFLAIMLWERLSKLQIKLKSRRDLLFSCFLVAMKSIVSNSLLVLPQNFETYFFDNIGINMPTHPYAKLELLTSVSTQQGFNIPLLIWYQPFHSNNISAQVHPSFSALNSPMQCYIVRINKVEFWIAYGLFPTMSGRIMLWVLHE